MINWGFKLQNKPLGGDNNSKENKVISGSGGGGGGLVGGCRTPSSNSWLKSRSAPTSRSGNGTSTADMNVQLGSAGSPTLRLASVKV